MILLTSISAVAGTEQGAASWYGHENVKSSTGKRLQHHTPATAHRTLPIGSVVKITAVRTGKTVIATVVDRGPYTRRRLVDVNIAAARRLGMITKGVVVVKVETIK